MSPKPLALDLFCGRGGWTRGLLQAGFDVVGIDVEPQPAYPKAARFVQADIRTVNGADYACASVVVASPPCTGFSRLNFLNKRFRGVRPRPVDFELLAHAMRVIGETGARFWAVENVEGAISWFEPILGHPQAATRPYWLWGQFPGFLLPTSMPVKVKTGAVGGQQMPDGTWNRATPYRTRQRKDKELAAKVAEIPIALSLPFALACMEALDAPKRTPPANHTPILLGDARPKQTGVRFEPNRSRNRTDAEVTTGGENAMSDNERATSESGCGGC